MKDKLLLLIICIANFSMYAQNINIHGKVLDDNKHILSGASIALYLQDSILIAGTTSNEKGTFILENIEPNNYKISVSYVGFLKENIDISQLTENLDLGNIVLQSDAILEDLVVTASNKHYEVNRQIILPSKEQMEVSNNALTLTRNLQLSLIQINPVTNDITTFESLFLSDSQQQLFQKFSGSQNITIQLMNDFQKRQDEFEKKKETLGHYGMGNYDGQSSFVVYPQQKSFQSKLTYVHTPQEYIDE